MKHIFSFETAFVLFLFSYQYKNAHPIFLNPDITLTLIGILIPWALILGRKSFSFMPAISFLLFGIWCVASAFWAPELPYVTSKTLCFCVYTMPAFFMAHRVIGSDFQRLKRFFALTTVFAVFVHFEAYREFYHSSNCLFNVLGNNYLVTGQTLGCGFILLTIYSLFSQVKSPWYYSCALMPLCGTFFYIQLNLGGRGPVVGFLLTLIVLYSYGLQTVDRKMYLGHLLRLTFVCVLSYWLLRWLFSVDTNNFVSRTYAAIATPDLDDSLNLRLGYYKSAIEVFLRHPLVGAGFGGWVNFHDMGGLPWQHPHNIVLEVLSETGIIGGVLASWFAFTVLKAIRYKDLYHFPLEMASACLFLFSLLNALKSGDINDNVLLFVMAGIILGVQANLRNFHSVKKV